MAKKKPDKEIVWKGFDQFRQFLHPIDELKEDPENAVTHSDRNLSIQETSLDGMGQHRLAVMVDDHTVQIGNAMLRDARKLGWTHLAAVHSGDEGAMVKLRSIVDNRASEVGRTWALPQLELDLESFGAGIDLDLCGFGDKDVKKLFREVGGVKRGGSPVPEGAPIRNTVEQRVVIDQAIDLVRTTEDDPEIKEGRCLELIAADYLASCPGRTGE